MWPGTLLKNKAKALLIHLGISLLIFIPFLYLIWVHWFPPPMFFTDGGWQGVRIMLVVDLVIGPSLTFLIFNPAKSRRMLRFDFACIGLVQAAALVYGYVSVESKRIQAVVLYENEFHAVTKDSFDEQLKDQVIEPQVWNRLGQRAPYWVYLREAQSAEEQAGAIAWEFMRGTPRHELAFLYEPLAAHWTEAQAAAIPWTDPAAQKMFTEFAPLCADYARTAGAASGNLLCFGLRGYFRPAIVMFDKDGQRQGSAVGKSP